MGVKWPGPKKIFCLFSDTLLRSLKSLSKVVGRSVPLKENHGLLLYTGVQRGVSGASQTQDIKHKQGQLLACNWMKLMESEGRGQTSSVVIFARIGVPSEYLW